jgi:hypothetical protein
MARRVDDRRPCGKRERDVAARPRSQLTLRRVDRARRRDAAAGVEMISPSLTWHTRRIAGEAACRFARES